MTATIAARIVVLLTVGMDIRTAYDTVLGAGSYDALAADLHTTLQAKVAA